MLVLIAIGALIVLAFLWAWHLDRRAKRDGSREASPADLTRGAHDSRVGIEGTVSGGGFTGQGDDRPL
ncbi:MAG TPA: hypothetical protein VIJ71_08490 [Mycobacteriales bacterium]